MVTMRFAAELAKDFDLHLVCLRTPSTPADPSAACIPPFTTVTIAESPHQRSPTHRLVLGAWYWLLNKTLRRPIAVSIEGSRAVQRAVRDRASEVGAQAGIAEYWSAGRVLGSMPEGHTTLILLDVEHERVPDGETSRCALIQNEELAACRMADRVIFLSDEDHSTFSALGVGNGVTVHIPVTEVSQPKRESRDATKIVVLGHLDWGPNERGLDWFLQEVWPTVRSRRPEARLSVIGRSNGRNDGDGVSYLGFVEDLRGALELVDIGVVPTIDGTGVKTKTLDLLAAGLPLVSTTNGVRGTSALHGGAVIVDDAQEFANSVLMLLQNRAQRTRLVAEGREQLLGQHSSDRLAERLIP